MFGDFTCSARACCLRTPVSRVAARIPRAAWATCATRAGEGLPDSIAAIVGDRTSDRRIDWHKLIDSGDLD